MELVNSKRLLYTASYVTTVLKPEEQKAMDARPGGGVFKANVLRALDVGLEDLERLTHAIESDPKLRNDKEIGKLFSIIQKSVRSKSPVRTLDLAESVASVPHDTINSFIELSSSVSENPFKGNFLLNWSRQQQRIFPIGRLHLERIEMYPAGIEKGELVFTVPMAPGETVTISHKEWSTSSREFEEIVQDFFESYSEKGVAEKSDVSMSSENEAKHSNAINFGATLTGSYTGVTLTTTLGINSTNEERQSVKKSIQQNREVTEKASARTRKEHKVSIKLENKSGTEDSSFKTFTNDSTHAIRVDYYRMMRKWRTDLYRYGLRQTYDITIPLPGVRLWAMHQQVAEMDRQLRAPLNFPLKPDDIETFSYKAEAIKWGANVQEPPPETIDDIKYGQIDFLGPEDSRTTRFAKIEFDVPEGYFIDTNAKLEAHLAIHTGEWDGNGFNVVGAIQQPLFNNDTIKGTLPVLFGKSHHQAVIYKYRAVSTGTIAVSITYKLEKAARDRWKFAAWNQIHTAALARHQEDLSRLQEERDRLFRLLNGKDTLTLRRLEREELVRLVMQWLLGPSYPFVASPGLGSALLEKLVKNETDFRNGKSPVAPNLNATFSGVSEEDWIQSIQFGESIVKFIHQAIEWENLLYFLYPYFWGSENVGRDKILFEHDDPEHERFLRAGYARIVLTVRPGFEEDFTTLMEQGSLKGIASHPYMTAAQEIANFAHTNYANIPPANPELQARPLLFPEQRATWDRMQETMKLIDDFKAKNGNYPAKLADLAGGAPVDAWGNELVYRLPGLGGDYDLISLGADNEVGGEGLDADISSAAGASLVATWNEYTPTSALDIEVDSKPEDIA